jgi:adenosylcobyric acid synthase
MSARALLVLGTGSHVGKSLVTAGLCRILANQGYSVAPFKAQNMALNSGVTPDGGEIGRAQMLQARAARCQPSRAMNPVLLKPVRGKGSQVILEGKPLRHMTTDQYFKFWPRAAQVAKWSYRELSGRNDWVLLEGAGSPAEVNLAHRDLANLEAARFSGAGWILVVDIERGGSFAAIVGTLALVPAWLRPRLRGVIFNKFRGNAGLLEPGLAWLWKKHRVRTLGVLPYFPDHGLEEEDSLGIPDSRWTKTGGRHLKVEVIRHRHLSNFNDLLPLESSRGIQLFWRKPGDPAPWAVPDLVVLPGSKDTVSDLQSLRDTGEALRLETLAAKGVWVLGLCGGLQMLGREVKDNGRRTGGLGLLDLTTHMARAKTLSRAEAELRLDFGKFAVRGYEIHHGVSHLGRKGKACFPGRPDLGAMDAQGRILGTYLHGILENDTFRTGYLTALCRDRGLPVSVAMTDDFESGLESRLDAWARHLEKHLDLATLFGKMLHHV